MGNGVREIEFWLKHAEQVFVFEFIGQLHSSNLS